MLGEHVKMALSSIRSARFRSFLTMFGVIIAVVSVITTVSVGEGIKHQVAGQTHTVGKDLITVRPGKLVKRDSEGHINGINFLAFLASNTIDEKDVSTIAGNSSVDSTVPLNIVSAVPSLDGQQFSEGFVMATNEKLPEVINHKVEFGNFFGVNDSGRDRAVIGLGVAEKLFKENVPIGKTFQIRGQDFVVGGVFERFPSNPLSPEIDFNNGVYIPVQAAKDLTRTDLKPYEVLVRPKDKSLEGINRTVNNLSEQIKKNHDGQDDVTVLRQDEMEALASSVFRSINRAIAVIAAVALFVGGIGIMNVMLVTVTERTREIGIRKAVGATNRQIRAQFLTEAIVISTWGALIGILLSGLLNLLLRIVTNIEPVISWEVVVASALASIACGIVFGMIPAIKASRKHPIESLRSF